MIVILDLMLLSPFDQKQNDNFTQQELGIHRKYACLFSSPRINKYQVTTIYKGK